MATAMRAALADLKILHETGLLDEAAYLAAQQQWVAKLAGGGAAAAADDEDEAVAEPPDAPRPPAPEANDEAEERRKRRREKQAKREAKARSAQPEPEPEPELPPGHGTPLEPLCAVLPQFERVAFTLALRAAALHLVKRDVEIDRKALSNSMASCGLSGKGKHLAACGFLMKESGKGGGRKPDALQAALGPLGFSEMHLGCLVATLAWVKSGAPPGIGDPIVEGWAAADVPSEDDSDGEPPPPPPHSPSPSEDEHETTSEEDEEEDGDDNVAGSDGSLVVVTQADLEVSPAAAADSAIKMPFQTAAGPAPLRGSSRKQPAAASLSAADSAWGDGFRKVARGHCRRSLEIWLSEAGIGGNAKSSSLRGFDTGPILEFADRENLLEAEPEELYKKFVDAKVEAAMAAMPPDMLPGADMYDDDEAGGGRGEGAGAPPVGMDKVFSTEMMIFQDFRLNKEDFN